jgi:hypothetical protein
MVSMSCLLECSLEVCRDFIVSQMADFLTATKKDIVSCAEQVGIVCQMPDGSTAVNVQRHLNNNDNHII